MRVLAFLAVVWVVSGCGGAHRRTVADCLNDRGFLVTARAGRISGTSPAGTGLTLVVYSSAAAAGQAAAKLGRRGTAVVGTGVIDFRGNPSTSPALSKSALATIRNCLAKRAD